jgi:hypothetical protein
VQLQFTVLQLHRVDLEEFFADIQKLSLQQDAVCSARLRAPFLRGWCIAVMLPVRTPHTYPMCLHTTSRVRLAPGLFSRGSAGSPHAALASIMPPSAACVFWSNTAAW